MDRKSSRKSIKISDQQKIIEEIASGSRINNVAKKYGISRSCVSKIYKRREYIASFSKSVHDIQLKKIHKVRLPMNVNLETVLYLWFCQQRSWGQFIGGSLLCKKALYINKMLGGSASFKASNGWLYKFKRRHGICQLSVQGEKLSCNFEEIQYFPEKFKSFVTNHGYTLQNIYNADETGLNWKTLPASTLAAEYESSAAGFKVCKERLTVMMCANANGTHRLPILVVYKYKRPRYVKNLHNLSVVYKAQKNAWMDRTLFSDWYANTFIKWVLEKQAEEGRNEKVLLILDNAPSHPSEDQLNSVHENFKVMFLSPNVAAVLQPMDHGIIEQTKRNYKKNMLRLLLIKNLPQIEFLKQLTILDCCNMIAEAWNDVSVNNLTKAWKDLLFIGNKIDSILNDYDEKYDNFFNEVPNEISTQDEIDSWLNDDTEDQGWEPQNINGIINNLQNNYNAHDSAEEEEPEDINNDCIPDCKLPKEIIQAVHTFRNWLQYQEECTAADFNSITKMLRVAEKQLHDVGSEKKYMPKTFTK